MAVKTVSAILNGTPYALAYNPDTGAYEGTMTAPNASSFNQKDGYYSVVVEAVDESGNIVTADSSGEFGENLKLVVKETAPPVIFVSAPSNDAVLTNNQPVFMWQCTDNNSGVKTDSIKLFIDEMEALGIIDIQKEKDTDTYSCAYTPEDALDDGVHTVKFVCSDNDGNIKEIAVSIKIDTVAPSLSVSSPAGDIFTNVQNITVRGVTNDITSSPVTVQVNGSAVNVDDSGQFETVVDLELGQNTITIEARDGAGKTTVVTRTVVFDNIAPVFHEVVLTPDPVDAGKTFTIRVIATDE